MFLDIYQHAAKPGMPKWPCATARHNLGLLIPRWLQLYIWSIARILNDFFFKLKMHTFSNTRYKVNFGDNDTGLHYTSFCEREFHWLSDDFKMNCQLKYGQGESNFNKQHYANVCHLCACYTYTTYNTKILFF